MTVPSGVVKLLRRTLAGVLCYGFVFSYPSWTIVGRLYASEPKPDRIQAKGKPPAEEGPPADKPEPKPKKKKDDVGLVPKEHKEDKDEDAPKRHKSGEKEKEIPPLPPAMSCSDDNFYLGAVNNYGKKQANPGDLCGSTYNGPVGEKCWTQVYMLLAAADANANYYHNPEGDPGKSTAVNSAVENSYLNMKDFRHDVLASDLGRDPTKKSYVEVIDQMSNPNINQGIDHKACCMELVEKAQHVGDYIKSTRSPKAEYNLKPSDVSRFDKMFAKQKERCESSHGGVVIPPPAKEKKKTNWWLVAGIALLVGGLLYLLLHKKKKGKKHPKKRKTEKPEPCKQPGCEGGTTGTETTTTTAGSTTVNPNTVTGATTATANTTTGETTGTTYPATTGETGRDNTTGESTGNTAVTNGNNPGRDVDNTTGTVTGSTTATTGTSTTTNTGTDSGGDTYPSNGDRPNDRTTSGTPRTLTPGRTLIKK